MSSAMNQMQTQRLYLVDWYNLQLHRPLLARDREKLMQEPDHRRNSAVRAQRQERETFQDIASGGIKKSGY